jgi:hypothetical protein
MLFLGKLPAQLYSETLQTADIDPRDLTKYKWGFTKKMSAEETLQLDTARDRIARDTKTTQLGSTSGDGARLGGGASLAERDAAAQMAYEQRIARERAERKRFNIQ